MARTSCTTRGSLKKGRVTKKNSPVRYTRITDSQEKKWAKVMNDIIQTDEKIQQIERWLPYVSEKDKEKLSSLKRKLTKLKKESDKLIKTGFKTTEGGRKARHISRNMNTLNRYR